ncbi:MAG: SUMF1/EgtB/PvdO family nonheme iron enzyme [Planctomycetes bacterium]|nr:SUMF1/EgtB/PvdO family nonheme iron enzyme [Planctomycetota bacterium]
MGEKVDIRVDGYHLTDAIGTGGMGSVFRATVEADDKPVARGTTVAVKLLHPHLRTIEEFVKRFHREARLAASIDHPNVVRVLDEGCEDRKHYIVMEMAEGLKLNDLIGDNQPLSPQQTIEVMNQVCDALGAAAAVADPDQPGRVRNLVHRDIKPDNIMIQPLDRKQYDTMTRTGDKTALANIRVKLLDFGLAKDVKALSTILSQTGQSLGTPAYMSPEQCRGDDVDGRSDIYSLGVVAYHMITGTQPFAGPTTVAYATQHAEEIPPDILGRNPLCPKNLADCIYRCLAKDPKDRYAEAAELQADLVRVSKGQTVAKVYKFKKKGSFSHRKVAAIMAATAVILLLAVAGGWFFLTDRAKADFAEAVRQADVLIAAQDYAGASSKLQQAIADFPNRANKAQLTAPAHDRLRDIAAKAAEQESARMVSQEQQRRREHEAAAVAAVAAIKAKTAAADYQGAIDAANAALTTFADTPAGAQLPDLLAGATEKLRGRQEADKALAEAQRKQQEEQARIERDRQTAEAAARRERFVRYRDEGQVAYNRAVASGSRSDYLTARASFEAAIAEQQDAEVQRLLQQCIDRTTRHRIAVADFSVTGDVGIADAGKAVGELLLSRFGADRYQLVERSHLAAILAEHDLTMAEIVSNPARLRGKNLAGVRYIALGSVVRLGNIAISARVVDVTSGDIIQTAEVSAEDARGLQNALAELARILQMTPEEKKAYLDSALYPQLLAEARSKRQARQYDDAISIYQRVLAIRSTVDIQDELSACRRDKDAWERLQADERERQRQEAQRAKERQEADRERDQQFASLVQQARAIADTLPADRSRLTESQKSQAQRGVSLTDQALAIKPGDATATALKSRLAGYLGPEKELTLDLGGGVSMKLVLIPAGRFMMGSPSNEKDRDGDEGPQRQVTISKPFYMGVYEVTQAQYEAVMGNNPSHFKGANNPVEQVSWNDATEFCRRLSQRTGKTVRLPTEAEWEYACRAGTTTRFYYGDDPDYRQLGEYAWYNTNSNSRTQPVGQKRPNAFGLYDMHGNVYEWCSDWFADSYANANNTNPTGPASGSRRVLRGGSWICYPRLCRSALRYWFSPVHRGSYYGFRVVVVSGVD